MKWINNISVLFLALIFLLSATGIVVLQTHCVCTGNNHVSLYVNPQTCNDSYYSHHVHLQDGEEVLSSENECHECTSHAKKCGCKLVSINYLKLKNEVVFEKGRTKTNFPVTAVLPKLAIRLLSAANHTSEKPLFRIVEPPVARTSLDFLIYINQLKIPHTA